MAGKSTKPNCKALKQQVFLNQKRLLLIRLLSGEKLADLAAELVQDKQHKDVDQAIRAISDALIEVPANYGAYIDPSNELEAIGGVGVAATFEDKWYSLVHDGKCIREGCMDEGLMEAEEQIVELKKDLGLDLPDEALRFFIENDVIGF